MSRRIPNLPVTVWLLVGLMAVACSDPETQTPAADSVSDTSDTSPDAQTDTGPPQDAGSPQDSEQSDVVPTMDPLDDKALGLLDAMWQAMAKKPIWKGYPLATVPMLLLHRAKSNDHGLLLRWPETPANGQKLSHPDIEVDIWWTNEHNKTLLPAQEIAPHVTVAGQLALAAAYSTTSFKPGWEWPGKVARAAFIRMQEVEQAWKAVEGCGLAKYPRKEELIELTLLEDAVLGEILAAEDKELEGLARDLQAVRARRIEIDPYTMRIDDDAENANGAPRYAELMVPVRADLRDADEVKEQLAEELGRSMKVPVSELDDLLMWHRPLTSAVVMLQMADRLAWDVSATFKGGKAIHEVAGKELGPADGKRVDAVKARHDAAAMVQRAKELMKL